MNLKNRIKKVKVVSLLLLLCSSTLLAENHHFHGDWEIGVSAGYANLKTESEDGTNLHLHLMRSLGEKGIAKYLSLGVGMETIVTEEEHYGVMLTLDIHPIEDLTIGVSPGFEWAKHDGISWEREYATHLELTYSFDMANGYHIGPSIGYSVTKDSEHYTFGIHLGIGL
jgi:hypothetical protein